MTVEPSYRPSRTSCTHGHWIDSDEGNCEACGAVLMWAVRDVRLQTIADAWKVPRLTIHAEYIRDWFPTLAALLDALTEENKT